MTIGAAQSFHEQFVVAMATPLAPLEWRFNNRGNPYLFRDTLIRLLNAETHTYERLTGAWA
jgi:hypothetical protein